MRPGHAPAQLPSWLRHLPALLGTALGFGAIWAVQHTFSHLKLADIARALDGMPRWTVALALCIAVCSYAVLTIYDRLGTIYAGHKLAYPRVAFASFCAYALSHNLGFGTLSGGAVRYRLYAHWGLTPLQIAKTVAFCSITFSLGSMVLGGAILLFEPRHVPFFGQHLPLAAMHAAGALLWVIVAGYGLLAGFFRPVFVFGYRLELPGWRMALLQVPLATADVSLAATIIWVLLPHAHGLSWSLFLGIYVASYTAGLLAALPGGLGVFDSALLFGLSPFLAAPRIVAAIVVFRIVYYVIPLFVAGTLFAANEVLLRGSAILTGLGRMGGFPAVGNWSEPDFAVAASCGAVAISGIVLLGVGLLSPHIPDLAWADPDVQLIATQAGQFVPSLIGAGLLVLGAGLVRRVNLAWIATIVLLLLGAAFILAEGEPGWIAGLLLLTALLLAPFRTCFYRHAKLVAGPLDPATAVSLLALVVCLLALAGFRRRIHGIPNNAWWELVLSREMPWGLRASVALTVVLALAAIWMLLRPGRVRPRPWDPELWRRLAGPEATLPLQAEGIVWGEAERAAIPFRRVGRVLLALGDPAGAENDRVSAIWRLRDLAQEQGLDPAVWRARPELLKVYNDLGLAALPLGPDGLPLSEPAEETPPASEYLVCVAERDLSLLLPLLPRLAMPCGQTVSRT